MKAHINMYRPVLRWLPFMTIVFSLVLVILAPWKDNNPLLGIPPTLVQGNIDPHYLAGWLLMMAAPILVDGCIFAYVGRIKLFIILRARSWAKWYKYVFVSCLCGTLYWSLLQWLSLLLIEDYHIAVIAGLLLLANNTLWLSLTLMLFYLMRGESLCILGPIFGQGITFLLGELVFSIRVWMPADWSMICRTNLFWEYGVDAWRYFILSAITAFVLLFLQSVMVRRKLYKEI